MNSTWMRLLNAMKERARSDHLTRSQAAARERLIELVRFPNMVNLYGPEGSGKTFLIWTLVDAINGIHFPIPEALATTDVTSPILLIDNAPHHEIAVRRLMAEANLRGVESMVFVTQQRVNVPMATVQLPAPTSDDIALIRTHFEQQGFLCGNRFRLPASPNLWQLMLAYS